VRPEKNPSVAPIQITSKQSSSISESNQQWDEMKAEFARRVQAGEFSPGRQQHIEDIMREFEQVLQPLHDKEDIKELMIRKERAMDIIARFTEAFANPSGMSEIESGLSPRAQKALQWLKLFKKYFAQEFTESSLSDSDSDALGNLAMRTAQAQERIVNLADDQKTLDFERESFRHLGLDVKHYALRHHVMIAKPIWSLESISENPNAIFFSGGGKVQALVQAACQKLRLQLLRNPGHKKYAQERWEMLRNCHVAVFDFTSFIRDAPSASAQLSAAVAYELGIALSLGKAVLIVAQEGQDLPFDIDLQSVYLQDNNKDFDRMLDAIDTILYGHQHGSSESSTSATLHFLSDQLRNHTDTITRQWLESLRSTTKDPIAFHHVYDANSARVLSNLYLTMTPAWPGGYPETDKRQCFHVTAFREYTKVTTETIRRICGQQDINVEYIRGDEMMDPNIVRSIWDGISRSTFIIVDLTSLNANVMLELGIAHTLGRKTLVIAQGDATMHLPTSIKKIRVIPYDVNDPQTLRNLETSLHEFLASSSTSIVLGS
jgi:hypothetical protein